MRLFELYLCHLSVLLDVIEAPAPSKGYTPKVSAVIIFALPHNILTVLCKSNANGIRRISLFVLTIFRQKFGRKFDRKFEASEATFRLNKGRFFVEFSPQSETSRRKVSLRSLVFEISLRTDNRLSRVIKFVYYSCKQHEIYI